MKIKFNITDEITITNTTVKITAFLTGVIAGHTRDQIEAKCLSLAKKMFKDASWAFSNFAYQSDGLTFGVMATTRIDSSLNDQLEEKAKTIGNKGDILIQISNIDNAIPLWERRTSESELRVRMIGLARDEASKLGGEIHLIEFGDAPLWGVSNAKSASYAMVASMDNRAAPALGHSEKMALTAVVTIKV